MDKATPTPSPASVDKQAALVAKLRYMGKQYAAGQVARGGAPQKHYLEEAADEIEMMAWALSMNAKTPASAQENADLRNVIQAACIDGIPGLERAWAKYFPDKPITIKGAEVEHLAAQSAPVLVDKDGCASDVDGKAAQSAPLAQQAREYPAMTATQKSHPKLPRQAAWGVIWDTGFDPNDGHRQLACVSVGEPGTWAEGSKVRLFTEGQMRAYVDADRAAAQVDQPAGRVIPADGEVRS